MDGMAIAIKALLANNEVARFTLRFTADPLPSASQLASIAEEVSLDIDTVIKPLYCADITAFSVSAQNFERVVPTPPKVPYWGPLSLEFGNSTAIGPGTHSGDSLPPQCAVVATLRSALPGRSNLGRVYGFPPDEEVIDADGTITGHDFAALVEAVIVSTEDALDARSITGLASVFSAKLDTASTIILVEQGNRIDTQRRRLARTG